ncbi:hypothetical protein NIES23_03710 [Trichormus variabilis NIES-23]|uniref:Uncharacterized protein n=1 Tax=Trichormus variabilis NIES-23 TaxID=1973479 RepID=A0A1Z4KFA7_ANAVA|nr:hypothetical protein NIES23_03710 [Trichormus variabilis NIES-23]
MSYPKKGSSNISYGYISKSFAKDQILVSKVFQDEYNFI